MQTLQQYAAEEVEGIAALGIDPVAILLHAGTFLILFFLIRRFALDKINQNLTDRRDKIDESIENAEAIEQRLKDVAEETAKAVSDARAQADEIVAKANQEAGVIVAEAESTAQKRADEIVADAESKMRSELDSAKKALQKETLELVAVATEAIIAKKHTAADDEKLIKQSITELAK